MNGETTKLPYKTSLSQKFNNTSSKNISSSNYITNSPQDLVFNSTPHKNNQRRSGSNRKQSNFSFGDAIESKVIDSPLFKTGTKKSSFVRQEEETASRQTKKGIICEFFEIEHGSNTLRIGELAEQILLKYEGCIHLTTIAGRKGSGKSTLFNKLLDLPPKLCHIEEDNPAHLKLLLASYLISDTFIWHSDQPLESAIKELSVFQKTESSLGYVFKPGSFSQTASMPKFLFILKTHLPKLIQKQHLSTQQYLKQCLEEDQVRTKKDYSTRDTAEPSPNVSTFGKNHGKQEINSNTNSSVISMMKIGVIGNISNTNSNKEDDSSSSSSSSNGKHNNNIQNMSKQSSMESEADNAKEQERHSGSQLKQWVQESLFDTMQLEFYKQEIKYSPLMEQENASSNSIGNHTNIGRSKANSITSSALQISSFKDMSSQVLKSKNLSKNLQGSLAQQRRGSGQFNMNNKIILEESFEGESIYNLLKENAQLHCKTLLQVKYNSRMLISLSKAIVDALNSKQQLNISLLHARVLKSECQSVARLVYEEFLEEIQQLILNISNKTVQQLLFASMQIRENALSKLSLQLLRLDFRAESAYLAVKKELIRSIDSFTKRLFKLHLSVTHGLAEIKRKQLFPLHFRGILQDHSQQKQTQKQWQLFNQDNTEEDEETEEDLDVSLEQDEGGDDAQNMNKQTQQIILSSTYFKGGKAIDGKISTNEPSMGKGQFKQQQQSELGSIREDEDRQLLDSNLNSNTNLIQMQNYETISKSTFNFNFASNLNRNNTNIPTQLNKAKGKKIFEVKSFAETHRQVFVPRVITMTDEEQQQQVSQIYQTNNQTPHNNLIQQPFLQSFQSPQSLNSPSSLMSPLIHSQIKQQHTASKANLFQSTFLPSIQTQFKSAARINPQQQLQNPFTASHPLQKGALLQQVEEFHSIRQQQQNQQPQSAHPQNQNYSSFYSEDQQNRLDLADKHSMMSPLSPIDNGIISPSQVNQQITPAIIINNSVSSNKEGFNHNNPSNYIDNTGKKQGKTKNPKVYEEVQLNEEECIKLKSRLTQMKTIIGVAFLHFTEDFFISEDDELLIYAVIPQYCFFLRYSYKSILMRFFKIYSDIYQKVTLQDEFLQFKELKIMRDVLFERNNILQLQVKTLGAYINGLKDDALTAAKLTEQTQVLNKRNKEKHRLHLIVNQKDDEIKRLKDELQTQTEEEQKRLLKKDKENDKDR